MNLFYKESKSKKKKKTEKIFFFVGEGGVKGVLLKGSKSRIKQKKICVCVGGEGGKEGGLELVNSFFFFKESK